MKLFFIVIRINIKNYKKLQIIFFAKKNKKWLLFSKKKKYPDKIFLAIANILNF